MKKAIGSLAGLAALGVLAGCGSSSRSGRSGRELPHRRKPQRSHRVSTAASRLLLHPEPHAIPTSHRMGWRDDGQLVRFQAPAWSDCSDQQFGFRLRADPTGVAGRF